MIKFENRFIWTMWVENFSYTGRDFDTEKSRFRGMVARDKVVVVLPSNPRCVGTCYKIFSPLHFFYSPNTYLPFTVNQHPGNNFDSVVELFQGVNFIFKWFYLFFFRMQMIKRISILSVQINKKSKTGKRGGTGKKNSDKLLWKYNKINK